LALGQSERFVFASGFTLEGYDNGFNAVQHLELVGL